MKKFSLAMFSFFALVALFVFQNCDKKKDDSPADVTKNMLVGKEWTVSSVIVPANTATEDSDWVNFKVSFTQTNMTTSGHATGSLAVWPSGTYSVSEDGKSITRQDGIVMLLSPLTETNFSAIFMVPGGTDIDARIAALDGEYRFNME